MKLERPSKRIQPIHAAEAVGFEPERSEVLFDPRTDFDPNVKRRILEELADPKLWFGGRSINQMEYFYALFPDEFAEVRPAEWKEKIESSFERSINKSVWDKLCLAEKYVMFFPESAKDISQYLDKTYIESILQQGPDGSHIYLHCLFLQKFLFHEHPTEAEAHEAEWEKALSALPDLKVNFKFSSYMRALAYLRLLFPKKDIQPLITPELQIQFKQTLHIMAKTEGFEVEYAAMAWAATILSAETVGITPDGRIQFEMPKKSIKSGRKLPDRLGM